MTSSRASRDFSSATIKALRSVGVTIVDTTWLPDASGSFANGERGYLLDQNGRGLVRTHAGILAMVKGLALVNGGSK